MKHLLLEALTAIKGLRRENEILRAKVEVIETFRSIVNPSREVFQGSPCSPIIEWEIENELEQIKLMEDQAAEAQDLAPSV